MKERFWLIHSGVPWSVVFGNELPWQGEMPEVWAYALSVLFSEFNSPQKYNWNSLRWEENK